jgi:hypothetical protein
MARATRGCEYSEAFVEEVCNAIENSHKGLRSLCKDFKHWPPARTIRNWIERYPHFKAMYAQAKKTQIENLAEEIIEISDNDERDILEVDGEYGKTYITNNVAIARDRLRTDNRKWIAAKLLRGTYGDSKADEEKDKDDFVSRHRDAIDNG